jgi:hypothetical protein
MSSLSLILKQSPVIIFFDFLLTLLTLYILSLLNTKKLFFNKNYQPIEKRFFLWGDFVASYTDREKEKNIFKKLTLNKKIKRYISSSFIFIVGMSILTSLSAYQATYIPVLCAVLMLSTYWRHLYFVFLLKVIFSILSITVNSGLDRYSVIAVLILLLISLILFTKRELKLIPKAYIKFILIAVSITLIFPKTNIEKEKQEIEIDRVIKMKRTNLNLKLSKLESNLKNQTEDLDGQVDSMIKKIDAMEVLLENFPDIGIELKNDVSKTKIELVGMKKDMKSSLDNGKLSSGSVSKLLKRMKDIKGKKFLNVKTDSNATDAHSNSLLGSSGEKFSEDFEGGTDEILDSLKQIENKIDIRNSLKTKRNEIAKEVKKEKSKGFNLNDLLNAWWIGSSFFLLVYIKSLFDKKKTRILSSSQINEVIKDLKRLRSLKLTPNQEIIKSYNLWRDKIHEVHFEGLEVPPPMNLAAYFYSHQKKLHHSLNSISQAFCDCYYGDLRASEKELKSFRKNIQEILTH